MSNTDSHREAWTRLLMEWVSDDTAKHILNLAALNGLFDDREVHELKRTRSEAEANARVAGYREGAASVVNQLRALGVTVSTEPH